MKTANSAGATGCHHSVTTTPNWPHTFRWCGNRVVISPGNVVLKPSVPPPGDVILKQSSLQLMWSVCEVHCLYNNVSSVVWCALWHIHCSSKLTTITTTLADTNSTTRYLKYKIIPQSRKSINHLFPEHRQIYYKQKTETLMFQTTWKNCS